VGKLLFFFRLLPCHKSESSSFSIPFFPYVLQANPHHVFCYCLQINSLKALPLSSAYSRTTFLRLGSLLTYTSNPRKWHGPGSKLDNVCGVVALPIRTTRSPVLYDHRDGRSPRFCMWGEVARRYLSSWRRGNLSASFR